jgi:NodT family efflux transporter outer membrane factor (OMF) lipoprotein
MQTPIRILQGALIALLAAGCASPDGLAPLTRPKPSRELNATRMLADARLSEAAWPAPVWWTALGDPQLDRLEADALAGSPTLALARARLEKAVALSGAAASALRPRADAGLASTRERFSEHDLAPPPVAGSWRTESRLALDFGYELDLRGEKRAALAASLGRAEAARVDARAARLVLSVTVARGYVELARLYDRSDVAAATLAQRKRIYELTRQRVAAGIDTRAELKQAEAALPATREDIAALEEAIALTRDRLAALAGEGPDRGLALGRPKLEARGAPLALPSRLPASLLGRRPDVVASRWRVEAAAHGIEAAKARFYPDLNLLAFAGFQSLGLSDFLEAGSRVAGAGPALTLPLFDGGRLRGELAARDADYDAAVARYDRTLVDALRDLGDRLASIRGVAAQAREQRAALATAREAYALALARYREGVGAYLSVLSVESQVLAQQRLEADLRARELDNRIDLVRALGGGFEDQSTSVRKPS